MRAAPPPLLSVSTQGRGGPAPSNFSRARLCSSNFSLALEARRRAEEEEQTRIEYEEEARLVEEEKLKAEEKEEDLRMKAEEEARLAEGARLKLEEHESIRLKVEGSGTPRP